MGCRCASEPSCVGYTWLGGNTQECWLHNDVPNYAFASNDYTSDVYINAANEKVSVPADTYTGRVVRNGSWPLCAGIPFWRANIIGANKKFLVNADLEPFLATPEQCNQACGNDPGCTVLYLQDYNETSKLGECHLLSGSLSLENSENTTDTLVATLQSCKGKCMLKRLNNRYTRCLLFT